MKKSCEENHRIQISGLISDDHIRCFLKHFILSPHYYMCLINRKFVEFDSEGFGQYYSKRVPQRELVHPLTCLRGWRFSGMYSVGNAWLNAVLALLKSGELGRRQSHPGEPGVLLRLWTQLPRLRLNIPWLQREGFISPSELYTQAWQNGSALGSLGFTLECGCFSPHHFTCSQRARGPSKKTAHLFLLREK